jgi:hypothetical protein
MNLFGKKRVGPETVHPAHDGIDDPLPPTAATHLLTLDLSRAKDLAAMLASSRAAKFIEIRDLLAGLYIYEWDRIAAYWPEENRDDVEEMLREICQISPQRWNYWIELYDTRRRESQPQPRWNRFRKRHQERPQTVPIPSVGLRAVFDAAETISPFRDPRNDGRNDNSAENAMPVLTTECILLCMAKYIASDTGRKLGQSGLDVEQLQRAVLDPKRSPLR